MPNTRSAAKRLRQSQALHIRNKSIKSAMKTQIKTVLAAVKDGDFEKADAEFRAAAKKLDRAGAKRIIHPNNAGRRKSRLAAAIKKAKASA